MNLTIQTPRWALPLLKPARYKAVRGGRGSGKSHFVAEWCIEDLIANPDHRGVCIREVQKSLKFSSKQLLQDKIKALNVSHMFEVTQQEIRRIGGSGIIIFMGMQDHTAESIKSLEGFDWAWVEEAQNLSHRSLELLRPTIRKPNSELIFTWNPRKPTDAVDNFFMHNKPDDAVLVHVNYTDNPWCPQSILDEAKHDQQSDPETYAHVWLGGYATKSDAKIFKRRWRIQEFEPDYTFGYPLQGLDFGFAKDPLAGVRLYLKDGRLWISHDSGGTGLKFLPGEPVPGVEIELDETALYLKQNMPDFDKYPTYADCSRPESISYLKRKGIPRIAAAEKWPGSVEEGILHLKSYEEIIIHPRCESTIHEFQEYSTKVDPHTGEVTDTILDENNHYIDAIRYALHKVIRKGMPRDYSILR